jgi:hypothetical protein
MTLPHSVATVLKEHVSLEVESIDRMYLNVYVPPLQSEGGVACFFRRHRGQKVASAALMAPITHRFVARIEKFVKDHGIPLVSFERGQRKDDIAAQHRSRFQPPEGVVFVGKAQEKTPLFRTVKRRNPQTGGTYAWLVRSTAMVNHYYFYCLDRDFGPFFLKFCSYFPYNAKLCLNGHEYVKCQLHQEGVAFEALDNGILSCADPERLQALCDGLSAAKIDVLLRKWLRRLPHPFTARDRQAGYRYDLSVLQAEFSLTQVLDRAVSGRIFFEEVIRENLDLGRPQHVQLIFNRRVTRATPSRFRTRVITQGVIPSLYVDYKSSRIKQYHKEGRALRTEITLNNTRDFYIGKRLPNLPALRQVGFQANRRLLEVQKVSHNCVMAEAAFQRVNRPLQVKQQRASALPFADPQVQALWSALVSFCFLPAGFCNRDLREQWAPLIGQNSDQVTPGRMTYNLRRLRLHGLIERLPKSHRYRLTDHGLRTALFFTRIYARVLRPGLGCLIPKVSAPDDTLRRCFTKLEQEIKARVNQANLAA